MGGIRQPAKRGREGEGASPTGNKDQGHKSANPRTVEHGDTANVSQGAEQLRSRLKEREGEREGPQIRE